MARGEELRARLQIHDLGTVTATDAKNRFGDLLHRVVYDHEPVLVERNGRPMAVLVDIDQYLELKRKARVESKESPFSTNP
ncbi:MAG: type II toxin-antitoxin system Phd/YefM family antitoxin [Nitrospinaceae bacterium]|jgi:prevent-host-death family protein|nr:type II toxin-antitoxin system Phd/YefM family antitoxin [Nitrospinaceae bacterium]MBT3434716.1 type II toxin-antitoxin system Phd/YefM family antitoxin [Nitrospinaceae bacterium]MBT3821178.1 type II toxin-antitoxin system Phd/YefM family antitoxin [Nitrospinaceae bacterium]MBT4094998.1 type II toxin-antitoxin system Phd/YefM family antitoxin [Nitrospinaceae bacterium]MBT4432431.1 type II toxin-antitoxin system Phd/YefM family antitoxin [Nitrospinaceae bacterium]